MPSFDVVSKVNHAEVDNALNQSIKEIATRFDFRSTNTTIEKNAEGIVVVSNSEGRIEAALDVLRSKLVKRGVSLKHLDPQKVGKTSKGAVRQLIKIKEGIEREHARALLELVKGAKLKVTAAIQEDAVRITGKNKDDLQAAIRLLREQELEFEAQYVNFRD
ncbi:MAG: YajQ family cyclic di-GMP-binding protein [Polyangiales bacterium]